MSGSTAFSQTFADAIIEMHEARRRARGEKIASGSVSERTHKQLEWAVLYVMDEIRPHVLDGNDGEIRKLWEEGGVDEMADHSGKPRSVQELKTSGGRPVVENAQELEHIDVQTLLECSQLFDRLCKRMGIMPDTAKGRPKGKV